MFQNVSIDLNKYPEYLFKFVIEKGLVGTRFDIYEPEYNKYLCKWMDTFWIFKPLVYSIVKIKYFSRKKTISRKK